MSLADKFGRPITDLRVSVTDRCNFRCVYCRSADPENHMPSASLLSWDEYERLVRILVPMGIRKVRVTGGEPLVRPGVEDFIARLKAIGVQDVSMTTNGFMLAERCDRLVAAGMDRINISLDSLNREKFERITRTKTFDEVIAGIDAAQASRLRPVKVNAVLVRGINDDEVEAFAAFARERDLIMRFIEFMPLDADRAWTRDLVVTGAEVHGRILKLWPLVPVVHERSETARKFRFADGRGEIAHVPIQQGRPRPEVSSAGRRDRPGNRRRNHRHRCGEGERAPHQRAGFCASFAHDGFHRRLTIRYSCCWLLSTGCLSARRAQREISLRSP
jgi:GTP 3',8-cyclase